MKFEKITLEFTKYESLDIIVASQEVQEPTGAPTTIPQGTDPFESDKW